MIDSRFCCQLGTPAQHEYICYLLSKRGASNLRQWAANYLGVSVSKMSRKVVTVKQASEMIEYLKTV